MMDWKLVVLLTLVGLAVSISIGISIYDWYVARSCERFWGSAKQRREQRDLSRRTPKWRKTP